MKKTLLILSLIIAVSSCKKDEPSNTNTPTTNDAVTLKYKVNGSLQEYSGDAGNTPESQGVIAQKHLKGNTTFPATMYFIQALRGANNLIALAIKTDDLIPGNYAGAELFTFTDYNGNDYALFPDSRKFDINITRNSSGSIDGNFSGFLYWIKPGSQVINDSVLISEGEFRNVRVIY